MCELWKGFQEGPNSIELQSWQSNKFRWIILQIIISSSFCCPTPTLSTFNTFRTPTLFHLVYWTWNSLVYELNAHCSISVIWGLSKVKLSLFFLKLYTFSLEFCFGFEKSVILMYDAFKKFLLLTPWYHVAQCFKGIVKSRILILFWIFITPLYHCALSLRIRTFPISLKTGSVGKHINHSE